MKLLSIHGDIESNPEPTISNTPRKETQFNVISWTTKEQRFFWRTPKKSLFQEHSDFNVIQRVQVVLRLLNSRGKSICFYNSIMQVLYSLPHLWNFVQKSSSMDSVLVSRKALLEELLNSAESVMTSNYIFSLNLIDCKTGDQYDAYECLL